MKIAVDVISLDRSGRAGGATWVTIELIKGFLDYKEDVWLICTEENCEYIKEMFPDVKHYLCLDIQNERSRFFYIRAAVRHARKSHVEKWLEANQIDVMYCPFGIVDYAPRNISVVSTIHDIQHEYYPEFFSKKEYLVRKYMYRQAAKRTSKVVCISKFTQSTFCEKYHYPKEKTVIVYNAVQGRFSKENEDILSKNHLDKEKYIIYPANFWKHKNHERLLLGYKEFLKHNHDMKLVLTGNLMNNGSYVEDSSCAGEGGLAGDSNHTKAKVTALAPVNQLLKDKDIKEHIVLTGYVDDDELYTLLKYSKGLIFPSLFEGFGIPVVEMMCFDKPIASSNSTSLLEIGCSAIHYFDPKNVNEISDAFQYIHDAPSVVSEEDRKLYWDTLKKYDRDEMVQSYMNVFESVIKER